MRRTILSLLPRFAVTFTTLCLCVGVASGKSWKPGKNKLPRLSSHGQGISLEEFQLTHPGIVIVPRKRKR